MLGPSRTSTTERTWMVWKINNKIEAAAFAGVNCNISEISLVTEEAVIRALSASSVENLDLIEIYLVSGMLAECS